MTIRQLLLVLDQKLGLGYKVINFNVYELHMMTIQCTWLIFMTIKINILNLSWYELKTNNIEN